MLDRKWQVLITCFIVYTFDAMELVALSITLPDLRETLSLTTTEGGLLATVTLIGIGVSSLSVGWFADNFGRKPALLGSLVAFGLFTAAMSLPVAFGVLLALRFLAGIGLGGVWSTVSSMVVEAWPERSRGRAVAFVIAAFPVGGLVASLIAQETLPNWRLTFLVLGLAVILPVLLAAFFLKESEAWRQQREQARAGSVSTSSSDAPKKVTIGEIFGPDIRLITILATIVVIFSQIGFWGTSAWLPTYLTDRGLSSTEMARLVAFNNIAMFIGYLVFGWIADAFGRKKALALTLCLSAVTLPILLMVGTPRLLLVLGIVFSFFAAFGAVLGSYLNELFPTRIRTTGAGFCFNVGRGVSALAPFTLGWLAQFTSLTTGLMICAGVLILSALFLIPIPAVKSSASPARARTAV